MASSIARASRIRESHQFLKPGFISQFSICDIQEKFRPAIHEYPKLISTTDKLLRAANTLKTPIYVTTQNRSRLGDTVSELQPHLKSSNLRVDADKTLFSMITPDVKPLLPDARQDRLDAVIAGIESHICVTQTALDLLELGHRVYIVVDGVSSVNPEERGVALARLRDAGAIVTSSESVLFEVLKDAKSSDFKAISNLVKETKEQTKDALGVFAKI